MRIFMILVGAVWILLGGGCAWTGMSFGSGVGLTIGFLPFAGGVALTIIGYNIDGADYGFAAFFGFFLLFVGCVGILALSGLIWASSGLMLQ